MAAMIVSIIVSWYTFWQVRCVVGVVCACVFAWRARSLD